MSFLRTECTHNNWRRISMLALIRRHAPQHYFKSSSLLWFVAR